MTPSPSPTLRLQTLGRLRLSDDGGTSDVESLNRRPRKLALLVLLALSPRARTRDQLAEMFWGDQTEERARHSLSDALSHLRRVLGKDAITQRQSYVELGECPLSVDAEELARAAAGNDMARAVAVYHGPFLDGVHIQEADSFERWVDGERRRLEQLFLKAAAARCADLRDAGQWDAAAALASRWLDVAPASADAALIRLGALAAPGTRESEVAALEEYRRLRLLLSTSLNIAPDPAVTAFADRISARLAVSPAALATDAGATVAPRADATTAPIESGERGEPVAARRRSAPRWLLAASAVPALLALLAAWRALPSHRLAANATIDLASALPPGSLVVLPLQNLTADTSDAYLASGLTEEIASRLAALPALHLRSAPAGERLQHLIESGPASAGRALGVRDVLHGSIRRDGGRIRISVRLVDSRSGFQRWGAEYELRAGNLLALQDTIARRVAVAIGGELSSIEWSSASASRTRDPVAYDHYLRGNYLLAKRTPRSALRAIDEFALALHQDPGFAQAKLRVAYAFAMFYEWGWRHPSLAPKLLLDSGLAMTDAVIQQHPDIADAWLTHAYLLVQQNPRTLAGTRVAFERALAIDSTNAEAYYQYGQTLMIAGRYAEAADAYRHALRIDPERPITLMSLAVTLDDRGDVAESRRLLDSAVTMDPAAPYAYAVRGYFYARERKWSAARKDAETALGIDSSYAVPSRSVLAAALAGAGDMAGARAEFARALRATSDSLAPSPTDSHFLAFAAVTMGDSARALDLLERARPRGAWLWFGMQQPDFDPVRQSRRFRRLVAESSPTETSGAR